MYNCASGVHPLCMYAGTALPRNKTLEQLGLTESPELELREKIRSKTPVATPENVQVEASEDKPSIFVTWSPIQKQYYNSDSLTGYHVRYTTSSKDCRWEEIEVGPDETSYSLDFLDRGVAYAVSVAAANDVGMGPYSIPIVAMVVGGMLYIEELLIYTEEETTAKWGILAMV